MDNYGWRPINEFPGYMISPDGEIKNYHTGVSIAPTVRGTRSYARLYKDGKVYNRGIRKLVETTFPRVDPYEVLEDWVYIPGFEDYEINKYGRVRRVSTKRPIKVYSDSGVYVNLHRDGRTFRRSIDGLLRLVGR